MRRLADSHGWRAPAVAADLGVHLRTAQRWLRELRTGEQRTPGADEWRGDTEADSQARAALRRRLLGLAGEALAKGLARDDCPVEVAVQTLSRLRLLEEPEAAGEPEGSVFEAHIRWSPSELEQVKEDARRRANELLDRLVPKGAITDGH